MAKPRPHSEREDFTGLDVEHSSLAVRTACDIEVNGRQAPGRLKMTWKN